MPSATLAESRLSTAPSSVKDSAAGNTSSTDAYEIDGNRGPGNPSGSRPKWLPMVSTGKPNSHAATEASVTAISMPGQFGAISRSRKINATEPMPTASAAGLMVGSACPSAASLGSNGPGSAPGNFRPPRSLHLAGKDRDRDAAGEADGHGMRNIANERAKPQQADQGQHEPGEEDRQQQPFQAELGDGGRNEHDERAGRTADLIAAAAERRD